MIATTQPLLEVEAVCKSFGAENVLNGISFQLGRGRILGLVGENGAGKSTLAQCIAGRHRIDSGAIRRNGRVYVVPQEFMLIPTLTATENIFLGMESTRAGFLLRRRMRDQAAALLRRLSCEIDVDTEVRQLGVAARQQIEIARALLHRSDILIMDEPTTVLNSTETAILFDIMRDFRNQGGSIIYISHKLDEVRAVCDEIAVLRDGHLVSITPAAAIDSAELARRMVGRPLTRLFPPLRPVAPAAPTVLAVEHLAAPPAVTDAGFELHAGEILGVAGLAGAGRTELAEAICALRPRAGGHLRIDGREHRFRTPAEAAAAGIVYLPEDRQNTAVLADFSLADNITMASLEKYCRHGLVRASAVRRTARAYIERFRIKCTSEMEVMRNLSGGNQQKAAIAKYLDRDPRVFIFDEPTRGVDVGARGEIYEFIHELAANGLGCLLISSDLEELIGNCRRILVMRNGVVAGTVSGPEISEENIMYLATGVKK